MNKLMVLLLVLLTSVAQAATISTRFLPVNVANGIAGLDAAGKITNALLPSATMVFKGAWNATTNSPTLADGTGNSGEIYRVSVAGTQNLGSGSTNFVVGDFVIYNGSIWQRSPATDGVISVNSMTGAVTITKSDVGLGNVSNDAQIPLTYLDTDGSLTANSDTKVASQKATRTYVGGALTGKVDNTITVNGQALSANVTITKTDLGLENVTNTEQLPMSYLSVDTALSGNSDSLVPSQKAVKTYVDTGLSGKQNSLGFTAENVANKSTDGTLAANSDTLYASQKATKTYVDTAVGAIPASKVWLHQAISLVAGDITNQYVDASQDCVLASVQLHVTGVQGSLTNDYTLSSVASKTRISFVASSGWGTGSSQALVAGDVIDLFCQY